MPAGAPRIGLFDLFVQGRLLVPLTILLQLKFTFDHFLIPFGVVIDVLANGTLQFDKVILGHMCG